MCPMDEETSPMHPFIPQTSGQVWSPPGWYQQRSDVGIKSPIANPLKPRPSFHKHHWEGGPSPGLPAAPSRWEDAGVLESIAHLCVALPRSSPALGLEFTSNVKTMPFCCLSIYHPGGSLYIGFCAAYLATTLSLSLWPLNDHIFFKKMKEVGVPQAHHFTVGSSPPFRFDNSSCVYDSIFGQRTIFLDYFFTYIYLFLKQTTYFCTFFW